MNCIDYSFYYNAGLLAVHCNGFKVGILEWLLHGVFHRVVEEAGRNPWNWIDPGDIKNKIQVPIGFERLCLENPINIENAKHCFKIAKSATSNVFFKMLSI